MAWVLRLLEQQGLFSDKEEALRDTLAKLDSIDSDDAVTTLTASDITLLRRQFVEGQILVRDSADRLRQTQEEAELANRRKHELEQRLSTLEIEYEELLEKTIREEEAVNTDIADSMADLKVCCDDGCSVLYLLSSHSLLGQTRSSVRGQTRNSYK